MVQKRVNNSALPDVFQVKYTGVSYVVEEGGWDLYIGYSLPCAHLEYDGVEIIELEGVSDER